MKRAKWAVGDYGYKAWTDNTGVIVRVTGLYDDGTVQGGEFVSERPDGTVSSGGFWSGGRTENLHPLTDPGHVLVARLFEARRGIQEAKAKQQELEQTATALRLALGAMREAQQTAALNSAQGPQP